MEKQFQALFATVDTLDWQERRRSLRVIQENYEMKKKLNDLELNNRIFKFKTRR